MFRGECIIALRSTRSGKLFNADSYAPNSRSAMLKSQKTEPETFQIDICNMHVYHCRRGIICGSFQRPEKVFRPYDQWERLRHDDGRKSYRIQRQCGPILLVPAQHIC